MWHYFRVKCPHSAVKIQVYLIFSILLCFGLCEDDRCSAIKETVCNSVMDKKTAAPKETCTRRADKVAHEHYLDETTGQKFYLNFFGQSNWCEAHRFCADYGMQLISINDSMVPDVVVKILSGYGGHKLKIWADVYKNSNSSHVSEGEKEQQIQTDESTGLLTWAVVDQWILTVNKSSLPKQFFGGYQSNWTESGLKSETWPFTKVKKKDAEDFSRNLSGIISQLPAKEESFKEIWSDLNFSSVTEDPIVVLDGPIDQISHKGVLDDIVFEDLEALNKGSSKDTESGLYSSKSIINVEEKDLNCASVGIENGAIHVQEGDCKTLNYFICHVV